MQQILLPLVTNLVIVAAISSMASGQATTAYTIFGLQQRDYLGQLVRNAGDVNGDGCDDLLVSQEPLTSTGAVRVYSGSDGSLFRTETGSGNNTGFGCSFTSLGDLDADGFDDFAIGACYDSSVVASAGAVTVHSGATGAVLLTMGGAATWDFFGRYLGSIGDLDGDGQRDLVIGIPGSDVAGTDFGEVRIYSTATATVIHTFFGTGLPNFGQSIGSAGDLDGDGLEDLALGFPNETVGPFQNAGAIRVFSGASGTLLNSFSGTSTNENFGALFDFIGDMNGDGYSDLIVAEKQVSQGAWIAQNGRLLLVSGFDGSVLNSVWGSSSNEKLGLSLTTMDDFDGDGQNDLVVGYSPIVMTFSGLALPGGARVYSSGNFAVLAEFLGDNDSDNFGAAVATGDFNGDGLPDFAVGAYGDDDFGPSSGSVRVFSGELRTSMQIGGGQPNSVAAELLVNGYGTGTAKGPFSSIVQNGETFSLDFRGAPNCLVALYWSPLLNSSGWIFPGFGSFDLGTGPSFTDVQIVFDGFAGGFPYYGTDATGRFQQNYDIPLGWPTGPFVNIQGLIQHEQPWLTWATITAAHQLVVQ